VVCKHLSDFFEIVERHQTNRVRLQFGLPQFIPGEPERMEVYHKISLKKKEKRSRAEILQNDVQRWNNRHESILHGVPYNDEVYPNHDYFTWYWTLFRDHLWISRDPLLGNPLEPCAQRLHILEANYPSSPELDTMPEPNVAQEPSADHTFITPPPFNPSFNPSTDYN